MTRWFRVLAIGLAACSGDPAANAYSTASDAAPDAASDAAADHDEHHGDPGACETIGRTGGSDTCLLFAFCGHRHLQLDCSARFTCVCSEPDVDGGPTKEVVAEPIFCEGASTDLGSALEAATRACGF
jgi:hypothetical protein